MQGEARSVEVISKIYFLLKHAALVEFLRSSVKTFHALLPETLKGLLKYSVFALGTYKRLELELLVCL
jgi:hypothetical protein